MFGKISFYSGLCICIVALVSSCSSIPKTDSESGVVVIDVERTGDYTGVIGGSFLLEFIDMESNITVKKLTIKANDNYKTIRIPEGDYKIASWRVTDYRSSRTRANTIVNIRNGQILFYGFSFVINGVDLGNGGESITFNWLPLDSQSFDAILEELSTEPNFDEWKVVE